MSSARRRRLTSLWPASCWPRARLRPSWTTSFGCFPWEPPGLSLVEQRFAAIDGRRMTTVWTGIRAMCGPLYAVPEGTATDFQFHRRNEDWQV